MQSILIRFDAESLIKTKYLDDDWSDEKAWVSVWMIHIFRELHKEQSKVRWLICGWALGWCRPLKLTCHSAPKQLSNSWITFSHRQIEGESHHLSPVIYAIEFGIIPFDFTFQKRQLYFKKNNWTEMCYALFIFFPREFRKHWGLVVSASSTLHNHRTWWA